MKAGPNFSLTASSNVITADVLDADALRLAAAGFDDGGVAVHVNGRTCHFHPHSGSVNHLEIADEGRKLISSGQDGFMRSTDLIEGRCDLLYKWNDHGAAQTAVNYFARKNKNEFICKLGNETVVLYDSRKKNKVKIVAKDVPGEFVSIRDNLMALTQLDSVEIFDFRKANKVVQTVECKFPVRAELNPFDRNKLLVISSEKYGMKVKISGSIYNLKTEEWTLVEGFKQPSANGISGSTNLRWFDRETLLGATLNSAVRKYLNSAGYYSQAQLAAHNSSVARFCAETGETLGVVEGTLNWTETLRLAINGTKSCLAFNTTGQGDASFIRKN